MYVVQYRHRDVNGWGNWLLQMRARWMEQLAFASAIRRAGQVQAAWRGYAARRRFRVLGLRHSMEEEALKGASAKRSEAVCGEM